MGQNRPVARAQCGGTSGIKLAEAEANARIISAAPEAIGLLAEVFADHGKVNSLEWTERAASALNKARHA